MARLSYSRSLIAGHSPDSPRLRPLHVPRWQMSRDFGHELSLDPHETAVDPVGYASGIHSTKTFAEPPNTEASVSMEVADQFLKRGRTPRGESAIRPLSSTDVSNSPFQSTATLRIGHQETQPQSRVADFDTSVAQIPRAESQADWHRSRTTDLLNLRQESYNEPTADKTNAHVIHRERTDKSISDAAAPLGRKTPVSLVVPNDNPLTEASSVTSDGRERKGAEHGRVREKAQATPLIERPRLSPAANAQAVRKQPETKPTENLIHIGNVDIHVSPPPAPVARTRAVERVISRGYTSSFGLTQG